MARNLKLGIAPIGWTNDDLPELGGEIPFEQCVSEMALAGYEGCEVGTKFPKNANDLKRALELRQLSICNQWFSYTLTTDPFAEVRKAFEGHLDFLQAMGSPIVGGGECGKSIHSKPGPVTEEKVHFTGDEWNRLTKGLNELGKIARDRGLTLAFHHHMGTGIQSMAETDRLLDNTYSENVSLNYDCGHFVFAGEDPIVALERYKDRIAHIHLKDIRLPILNRVKEERLSFLQAVKAGIFTVPGDREGSIDFDSIFKIIKEINYRGWLVVEAEQDPAKADPLEYALMARDFIAKQLSRHNLQVKENDVGG